MSIDYSQHSARRIVHEYPDQSQFNTFTPRGPWKLGLHEVLALTASLNDAGYDTGEVVRRIDAISAALDQDAAAAGIGLHLTSDLCDLDPAEVVDRVRNAAFDIAASSQLATAREAFESQLALAAAKALRDASDGLIASMRQRFDPALEAVRAAADKGLEPSTDTSALLDNADAGTIEAYRALAPAVVVLDSVARLRFQMADVAGIGPRDPAIVNLLADAADLDHLDGAQDVWRDEVEIVQYDAPSGFGSTLARMARPRLGGPWLALLQGGYQVQLNTADQADQLLGRARAADAEAAEG